MTVCTISARIVVLDPEGREHIGLFEQGMEGPIRLGRAPENDIQIISPYISRRHAELWPHAEGVLFKDLSSTSGSYVDGARVEAHVLRLGDSLHLGSPDGLLLQFKPLNVDKTFDELPAHSKTEVLKVLDLDDSQYLSTSGSFDARVAVSKGRVAAQTAGTTTEDRLRTLIMLTSEMLPIGKTDDLAQKLLDEVMRLLPVERGMVLLKGGEGLLPRVWSVKGKREDATVSGRMEAVGLEPEMTDGLRTADMPELPFRPIKTVTDQVLTEGVGLLTLDAPGDERLERSRSVVLQSVRSILAVPISSSADIHGVLYLDAQHAMSDKDDDLLDWLVAIGRQAGMVIDRINLEERQKVMLESMMRGLAASIDARDGLTAGHSARVAHYSVGIARAMGLDQAEQYRVYYAALLHDYGKIGVDDAVLRKPASLTPEEYKHVQLHPKYTFDILSKITFPPELVDLPLMAASHHERWDGKGYPWGLKGEAIPLAGRIIAVADVYDALTRERHYRQPMPIAEVLAHLEEGRDSRFDPEVLNGFRRYFDQVLAKREDALERKRSRLAGVSEGGLTTAGFGPASEEPDTLFHTEDDDSDVETDRSSAPDTGAGFSSDLV